MSYLAGRRSGSGTLPAARRCSPGSAGPRSRRWRRSRSCAAAAAGTAAGAAAVAGMTAVVAAAVAVVAVDGAAAELGGSRTCSARPGSAARRWERRELDSWPGKERFRFINAKGTKLTFEKLGDFYEKRNKRTVKS